MILRPPPATRMANAAPGVVGAAFGALATAFPDSWEFYLWAPPVLVAGVVLAVRGYRVAVICRDDAVVVRDFFWSTTVPWAEVATVRWSGVFGSGIRRRNRPWWRAGVNASALRVPSETLLPGVRSRAAENQAALERAFAASRGL